MLDSNFILDAMNGVHEKQVIMAGEMLGYIEKKETVHLHRKLWSTILIAAILISLLGITAYALGVFQMWVEEMKPDADKAGHWVLQDSAGNDISYWLYDKFHTGISLVKRPHTELSSIQIGCRKNQRIHILRPRVTAGMII